MLIYADNAATTKTCRAAIERMIPYFGEIYGNPSSLHDLGQRAREAVETARTEIAALLGCAPQELYFTSGGTESDNWAIRSAAEAGEMKGKKHIISSAIEHHAVLHTLAALKKRGFEITLLPVNAEGIADPETLERAIRPDTALVSVMYANNEIGTLQPVREIGEICRAHHVLFHTDAVQAVGHLPVNFKDDGADLLSLSAHKFGGPKGVGALIAKKGTPLFPLIEGGAQERNRRGGTENVPAIAGMAEALKESVNGLKKTAPYVRNLRERLIDGLLKIPHTALNGHREKRLDGNASFCFEGIEGESLLLLLAHEGIFASSGSACTSASLEPSHVLLAIGRPHAVAHGSLRLTISAENTEEEVDYIIKKTAQIVEYLRGMSPLWQDLQEGKKEYVIQ